MSEESRNITPKPEEEAATSAESLEAVVVESSAKPDEALREQPWTAEGEAAPQAEPVEELLHHELHDPSGDEEGVRQGGGLMRKILILLLLVALVPLGWLGWRVQDYHTAQGHWPSVAVMKGWLSGEVEQSPFEKAWHEQHQAMQGQVLELQRKNEALAGRVQSAEVQNRDLATQLDVLSRRLDAVIAAAPAATPVLGGSDGEALGRLDLRLQDLERRVTETMGRQTVSPALLQIFWDRGWYGAVAALAARGEDRQLALNVAQARQTLLERLQGQAPVEEQKYWGGLVTLRQGEGASTRPAITALLLGDWQGLDRAMSALKGAASEGQINAFGQFEALRREGEGRWASSAS